MPKSSFAAAAVISQGRRELEGHSPETIFQILRKRFRNLDIDISDEELHRIASDIAMRVVSEETTTEHRTGEPTQKSPESAA